MLFLSFLYSSAWEVILIPLYRKMQKNATAILVFIIKKQITPVHLAAFRMPLHTGDVCSLNWNQIIRSQTSEESSAGLSMDMPPIRRACA